MNIIMVMKSRTNVAHMGEMHTKFCLQNMWRQGYLGDVGVSSRIILKLNLKNRTRGSGLD